ncbi:MAG TPA: acyltransferase [Edaphobacter sp.]|nr:acyltransferase [Edaphobacter sp.]
MRSLDGVRGLAILMVVFSHGFESNYQAGGFFVRITGDLFYYGLFGVDLFFVLSGFLITGILFDSLSDDRFFSKFYARRALRIFPLYYGVLVVLFTLTPFLHLHWSGMGWLLLAYLQNLRPDQVSVFAPSPHIGLYHFWSLAVEEQFYLVWPTIVFFVRGKRRLFFTTLLISAIALLLRLVLIAHGTPAIAIHVDTLCRADSLLLGGTLALLYRSSQWSRILKLAPLGFMAAAVIIFFSINRLGIDAPSSQTALFWVEGFRYTVLAFGFACLVAWSLRPHSIATRFFELAPLRFFGKYSYGIYVLHVILLPFFIKYFRAGIFAATQSKLLAVVGAGLLSITIGVIAAYLSYHLYEKRFLRLKRFFDYKPLQAESKAAKSSVSVV